ncbi:hypothetical protein BMS3Bbin02_01053 [bacterium BMS3Bbin02]|nr:hypothetical protein BMS3Bbin02_01053 [bacterium BMS3Bbin02]
MTTSISNSSATPQTRDKVLLSAAGLAAFTALLHIFGGGASVAAPLVESALAEEPRLVAFAVWQMASVSMASSAVALYVAAVPSHASRSRYMVQFVSVLWIGFGISFLGVAATQEGDGLFFKLPQWILLLPVGILGLWGVMRQSEAGETTVPSTGVQG